MSFVRDVQKDITLPGGGSVTYRKISRGSLDKARQARQIEQAQHAAALGEGGLRGLFGSPEARQAESDKAEGKKPDYEAAKKVRYTQYDIAQVLLAGIVRWTFAEKLGQSPVDQLDDEDAQACHEAILDLSLRPLDPDEYQAKEGKDSGASTSS